MSITIPFASYVSLPASDRLWNIFWVKSCSGGKQTCFSCNHIWAKRMCEFHIMIYAVLAHAQWEWNARYFHRVMQLYVITCCVLMFCALLRHNILGIATKYSIFQTNQKNYCNLLKKSFHVTLVYVSLTTQLSLIPVTLACNLYNGMRIIACCMQCQNCLESRWKSNI